MQGDFAVHGGEPVAWLQAPAWPVGGPEEERRLLEVFHDGPCAGEGPMEDAFREAWAEFCGARFYIPVTSGTTALQPALEALGTIYEPLNDCSLYRPHSKQRHRLGEVYWEAVDPSRYELPISVRVSREGGVLISHPLLLLPATEREHVASAIGKVFEHRHALRDRGIT